MYSLSGSAEDGTFRIGVKREIGGVASNHLHANVKVGDVLETSAPRGTFMLQERGRPVVLLSGGIGVTPLLAMLHRLANAASTRKVWWLHGARDGRHHPFRAEAAVLIGALPAARSHVVYSRPDPEDLARKACDEVGHLDVGVLTRLGVPPQSDFYLCGPAAFLESLEAQLRKVWGVDAARVYSEVFGVVVIAAGSQRPHPPAELGDGPLVTFTRSGLSVRWSDKRTSLLELAEACSVPTRWSCRTGVCQSCECPLIAGSVAYEPEPIATPSDGTVLLCCARPTADIELDL
jgi:ferredoxin-NADP reductase